MLENRAGMDKPFIKVGKHIISVEAISDVEEESDGPRDREASWNVQNDIAGSRRWLGVSGRVGPMVAGRQESAEAGDGAFMKRIAMWVVLQSVGYG